MACICSCSLSTEYLMQGVNAIRDIRERFFHYQQMQFKLQMNSKFFFFFFSLFPCVTWKPEKKAVVDLRLRSLWHYHCQYSTTLFILWCSKGDSWPCSGEALGSVFASMMVCSCPLPSLKNKAIVIIHISSSGNLFLSPAEEHRSKREVSRVAADAQQSFWAKSTPLPCICCKL